MVWTYEEYWNAVIGADRSASDVVREFELDALDRRGMSDWLGVAEAEAWARGTQGGPVPIEWSDHHEKALDVIGRPKIVGKEA